MIVMEERRSRNLAFFKAEIERKSPLAETKTILVLICGNKVFLLGFSMSAMILAIVNL